MEQGKIASFKRNISIAVREPENVNEELPAPEVEVLPTPTVQEVDKVFEKELEELEKGKQPS